MKTKILEAIKLIASGTTGDINYRAETLIDKKPFSKIGVRKTIINIEIIEKL